ncbi:hypothetical protein [Xylella taiwanensis]|uniref:hypothetical protein n=1 Tax=Xylella taiwanensis TaxID=1444770 RepID=UPI001F2E7FDF|nr:hypothetical protein [Xylella taiwanensis]
MLRCVRVIRHVHACCKAGALLGKQGHIALHTVVEHPDAVCLARGLLTDDEISAHSNLCSHEIH